MRIFDAILSNTSENAAIAYARGMVWNEIETTEQAHPVHSRHVETIGSVGIFYDYSADYYYFTEEDS